MTHAAPPILAQTCILAAIALVSLVGAALYREKRDDEIAGLLVFIGSVVCFLGFIAILGERAP